MKKRWKSLIAWVLIITIVGGYGNTALAAGLGDGIPTGTESSTGAEAGIVTDVGAGSQGETGGNSSSGEENKENGGSTGETGGTGETETETGSTGGTGTETGSTGGTGTETGGTGDTGETGTEGGNEGEEVSQDPADTIEADESPETEEELEAAALTAQAGTYEPYWENGNYSNLVVLVDFADSTHDHSDKVFGQCFKADPADTFKYFNGDEENPKGMRQYLYNISYGQLRVENIFPQYNQADNTITPYTLSQGASYYVDNEAAMVTEVIEQLEASGQIRENMNLHLSDPDYNIVDNLNIVVAGDSSNLFIDHKTTYGGDKKVAGCLVRNYTVVKENDVYLGYSESGVIIHEFLHSLGYPDTYRQGSGIPIGSWDIMSTVSRRVQYPLAYLRSAYTKWFEIPSISESQTGISLYAASKTSEETKDQQALILKTDYSDTEFFVVEYRKKGKAYSDEYEEGIPGSGLIVYRVNTSQETNYVGTTDLIYLFRPGDSYGSDGRELGEGNYDEAHLSQEDKRTSYGSSNFEDSLAEGAITYSDGKNSGIVISNVGSSSGDQITFDVTFYEEGEGARWSTAAAEKEGEATSEAASCMDKEGNFYFILKKGNANYLYQCKGGVFTRLGTAPGGSSHKLAWYNGQLYSGYLDSKYVVKLARWNGSSWQDLYTAPRGTNEFSMTSDGKGVYLAYTNTDGTRVYAAGYTAAGMAELGSQVAASTNYAANASIAAENGTIVVMYREAFNNNRVFVKQYNSSTKSWSNVGSQSFSANSGLIRIHSGKVYLMKNGSTFGENKSYLYVYDLRSGGSWRQVGSNFYADASIAEMDLCFAAGEPYVVYMSGSQTRVTEVKRLQEGVWTNLGGSVARETVTGLSAYSFDGQIYVTYLNTVTGRVSVKTHASESTGVEEGLLILPELTTVDGKNPFQVISEHAGTESGISLFAQGLFENSFRDQLAGERAGELYDLLVEKYVTQRLSGPQAVIFKTPVTFHAHVENGYLVPDDSSLVELENSFHLAYGAFYMDNPSVFWMQGLGYSISGDNFSYVSDGKGGCIVTVSGLSLTTREYYSGAAKQIAAYDAAVGKAKSEIEAGLIEPDDYDRVKAIHDYLCERLEYNYAAASNLNASNYGYAHTSSTAFLGYGGKKSVVCEGYAKAFKVLCDQWEIPCVLVIGQGGTPGDTGPHMWNYVQMEDGNWYGVDVTWDDQTSGIRSEYFLVGSGTLGFGQNSFIEEHSPDMQITTGEPYPFVYPELAEDAYSPVYQGRVVSEAGGKWLYISDVKAGKQLSEEEILRILRKKGYFSSFDGISIVRMDVPGKALEKTLDQEIINMAVSMLKKDGELNFTFWEKNSGEKLTQWHFLNPQRMEMDRNGTVTAEKSEGNWSLRVAETYFPAERVWVSYSEDGLYTPYEEAYADKDGKFLTVGYYRIGTNGKKVFVSEGRYEHVLESEFGELHSLSLYDVNELDAGVSYEAEIPTYGWQTGTDASGNDYTFYVEKYSGKYVTGWQIVNGKKCYFDAKGHLLEGPQNVNGTWYLFGNYANGTQGILTGYQKYPLSECSYYSGINGALQSGWQKIDNIWHYFSIEESSYGEELPSIQEGNWVTMTEEAGVMSKRRYYFKNNASLLENWQLIDGVWYMFDGEGFAMTGWYPSCAEKGAYYLDAMGRMQTGYVGIVEEDKVEHYFFSSGGGRLYGWQKVGDTWRYFQPDSGSKDYGKEIESVNTDGFWYTMEGERYYFVNNERLAVGWQLIGGIWYYFDPEGKMCTGTLMIGGVLYRLRIDGVLRGTMGIGLFEDAGEYYYANNSGALQTGWQKIDGAWRFFNPETGAEEGPVTIGEGYWVSISGADGEKRSYLLNGMNVATGWQIINGERYYFDKAGVLQEITDCQVEGSKYWYTVNGEDFCFDNDSTLLKGWQRLDGKWYYFDPTTGATHKNKTSIIGSGVYCFDTNGIMQENAIVDGYGYGSGGNRVKGWQLFNGIWYYFDTGTDVLQTGDADGLCAIGGITYYLGQDGAMRYGWIEENPGNVYYAKASGALASGWEKIGDKWYYFCRDTKKQDLNAVIKDDYFAYATENGKTNTYYFVNGNSLGTGWQLIQGKWYYFDENGIMQKNLTKVGSVYYFLGEDGQMKTGFVEYHGNTYYFTSGGSMVTGWQSIGGKKYYFNGNGELQIGLFQAGSAWYCYNEEQKPISGWWDKPDTEERYYFDANGCAAIGWKLLDGIWYYFDGRGIMQTGLIKIGSTYYLLNEDGQMQTGLVEYEGNAYYFASGGAMLTGWQVVGNKKYYFNEEGVMQTGLFQAKGLWYCYNAEQKPISGWWNRPGTESRYYFDGNGCAAIGWKLLDGKWYYFNNNGIMQRGFVKVGSAYYFLNEDGQMQTGLVEYLETTYYFASGGAMQTGWQVVGNKKYYFNEEGVMQTGLFQVGNSWYCCDERQNPISGWWNKPDTEEQYYFDTNGCAAIGWKLLDGIWYYFDGQGIMQTGFIKVGSARFLLNEKGQMQTGLVEYGGNTYYFTSGGAMQTGWQVVGNKKYYFNEEGVMQTGLFQVGNGWYCYDERQSPISGWWNKPDTEEQYYFDANGCAAIGWKLLDGIWYYFDGRGIMQTGFIKVGSARFLLNEKGQMQTGLVEYGGNTYYFASGGAMQTGWQLINGKWYYFNEEGELQTGIFQAGNDWYHYDEEQNPISGWWEKADSEDKYYFDKNGCASKGWKQLSGEWYYFDNNGIMQRGFIKVGSARFLLNEDGQMQTGLVEHLDETYYFTFGGAMQTGWQLVSGIWYYFDQLTGKAYRDGWYYVDNIKYLFDINGRMCSKPIISVTSNNYKTVEIFWDKTVEVQKYILEYATEPEFAEPIILEIGGGEETKEEIRELEQGKQYYFRLKYILESKKNNEIESDYSAVKSIIIQDELDPTSTSAAFQDFMLASITTHESEIPETLTGICAEFMVKGRLRSYQGDDKYYLVRVDSYSGQIIGGPLYEICKDDGVQEGDSFQFSFEIPLPEEYADDKYPQVQGVMSKYALAVKSGAEGYTAISKGIYVSNPEFVAKFNAPYYMPASKKGIQGAGSIYTADMGTKHTVLNLDLKDVVRGNVPFKYKGKMYYFSDLLSLKQTITEYNHGKYGNNISVSLVILSSYRADERKILIHPSARAAGMASYYTLNSSTREGQELYEAMFSYLGQIFGQDDCYVTNWILGNEVNSCNAWNYKGSLSFNEYMRCYAASFRQLYYGVKQTRASSRVFISLDNAWNQAVAGYTGKAVLDTFASYIYEEDPGILWNVAFHPYSSPLTRTDFWNDYSNTTNSTGSPFISMRNLDQLTNYLGVVERNYGKESGSIRVILSEQGWTSSNCGEYTQATAIAWAYYIAEFNSRVDAFIIRAEIDDYEEMRMGLYMGLRNYGTDTKKTSYYVYKYMDSPLGTFQNINAYGANLDSRNVPRFQDAQKILCQTDWVSRVSGFNMNKLNGMPAANPE